MKMSVKLGKIVAKLEDVFQLANEEFYNGELTEPVIMVAPDTTRGAYGWCTSWKAWEDGSEGRYEINITAEHLNRSTSDTVATLLHEMVHLYNLENGVQDTSRNGTYHNKKFKLEAEKRGLIIGRDEKYGWTLTELNDHGEEFMKNLDISDFGIYRGKQEKIASKGSSNSRKYECPECGTSVRATKEVYIKCGLCKVDMEEVAK